MSVSLPWYSWFASQWLASETRLSMNTSERAIYRDLLDHCYEVGSVPDNRVILANMPLVSLEEFDRAWPAVSRKFEPHPEQPARLVNPRVLSELAKRSSKSTAGRTGGVESGKARTKQVLPLKTKQVIHIRRRIRTPHQRKTKMKSRK
jgi:hypothetical protein